MTIVCKLTCFLFLPRCMECRRGVAMRILSVCLSVCHTRDLGVVHWGLALALRLFWSSHSSSNSSSRSAVAAAASTVRALSSVSRVCNIVRDSR